MQNFWKRRVITRTALTTAMVMSLGIGTPSVWLSAQPLHLSEVVQGSSSHPEKSAVDGSPEYAQPVFTDSTESNAADETRRISLPGPAEPASVEAGSGLTRIADATTGDELLGGQHEPPESELLMPGSYVQGVPQMSYVQGVPQLAPMMDHYSDPACQIIDVHEDPTLGWSLFELFTEALTAPADLMADFFGHLICAEHDEVETHLNPCPIGIQPINDRPDLIFECGEGFLKKGWLEQGIESPTGAIWRPSIWVFGEYRANIAYRDNQGSRPFTEVAHRLDLFGQLNLTGTERLLMGFRPLDEQTTAPNGRTIRDFRVTTSIPKTASTA